MIFLGVDVGQATDPSALVGVGVRDGQVITLGAEERGLGEDYAALVGAVDDRCRSAEQRGQQVMPVVDATGVGRPVLEGLRRLRASVGITLTAGRRHSGTWPDWKVPKALLVHVAVTGAETGEVEFPSRDRWPGLHAQILSLRHKGRGRIEGAGTAHDDLALAWLYGVYAAVLAMNPGREQRLVVARGGHVQPA